MQGDVDSALGALRTKVDALILVGIPTSVITAEELEKDGAGPRTARFCDVCDETMWVGPRAVARWKEWDRRVCVICLAKSGEVDETMRVHVLSEME